MSTSQFTLDSPTQLSRKTMIVLAVLGLLYAALVTGASVVAPRQFPEMPTFALAHALVSCVVAAVIAVLVFTHAQASGRRGYLVLGFAFAFVAGALLLYPLLFEGAVVTGRRILGGPQSSRWLFYTWRLTGLGCIALAAALLAHDQRTNRRPGLKHGIRVTVIAVVAALAAITLAVTVGHDLLPAVIDGTGRLTDLGHFIDRTLLVVAALTLVICLDSARTSALIGTWLSAIALLLLGDAVVGLRIDRIYSAGWYFNRVFGLLAYCAFLVVLVVSLSRLDRAHSRAATTDGLTGVDNRAGFLSTLEVEMARVQRSEGRLAVIWVDLDGFKAVNDQLGHDAGDSVLKEAAARIRSQVRSGDQVARIGGDEFAIMMCDGVDETRLRAVGSRIREALRQPVEIDGHSSSWLSASVGLAIAPDDTSDSQELLHRADLAMYAAKNAGGDQVRRFDERVQKDASEGTRLRQELSSALLRRHFELDYQPIVDPRTGEVHGAEALVRWVKDGRRVPAEDFIDFACRSGQIISIGHQVIEQVNRDRPVMARWFGEDFFVAMNMSAVELADTAAVDRLLEHALGSQGIELVVEVTDSMELRSDPDIHRQLDRIRAAGLPLAIDDFGSGYCSLEQLAHLEPRLLKVSRSILQRAAMGDERDVTLLRGITRMGSVLGTKVLIEGVETDAELQIVRAVGFDLAQGYRWSEPVQLPQLLGPRSPVLI